MAPATIYPILKTESIPNTLKNVCLHIKISNCLSRLFGRMYNCNLAMRNSHSKKKIEYNNSHCCSKNSPCTSITCVELEKSTRLSNYSTIVDTSGRRERPYM